MTLQTNSSAHLLEHVLGNIRRLGLPDLDPADMQLVHDLLNLLGSPSRRCCERDDPEIWMYGLKVRDALHVRVISGRLVCFIYDEVSNSAQSKSAKAP